MTEVQGQQFDYARRVRRVRSRLKEFETGGILITKQTNVRYLTGFTGSSGACLLTEKELYFITDGRYTEQAGLEVAGWEIIIAGREKPWSRSLGELLMHLHAGRWAVESDHLTLTEYAGLEQVVTDQGELVPAQKIVEPLRVVKDEQEQQLLLEAGKLTDLVFARFALTLAEGITERQAYHNLRGLIWQAGGEDESFSSIVLFGARTSLPHGNPGDTVLEKGDLVLVDFGVRSQGYCADMTRTFVFGRPHPLQRERHEAVLKAQRATVAQAKAGMTGKELDDIARQTLLKEGFQEEFSHSTGHGIGLEIHEAPRISPLNTEKLPVGAVVTIEPGIYLPNWGGIRIEDAIILQESGCQELTSANRDIRVNP